MSRRIRVLIPRQSIEAVRSIVRSSFFFLRVLLLLPAAAHAQSGSPFDTGFLQHANTLHGHRWEGRLTDRYRDRRLPVRPRRAGREESARRRRSWHGNRSHGDERSVMALGFLIARSHPTPNSISIPQPTEGLMPDQSRTIRRRNRVFKSLHKPLTYLGVERTLFFFVCVSAVGAFNLFNRFLQA